MCYKDEFDCFLQGNPSRHASEEGWCKTLNGNDIHRHTTPNILPSLSTRSSFHQLTKTEREGTINFQVLYLQFYII